MLKHFNQSKYLLQVQGVSPLDQVLLQPWQCGNMEVVQLWSLGTLLIIKSFLFNLNCDDDASHAKECLIAW